MALFFSAPPPPDVRASLEDVAVGPYTGLFRLPTTSVLDEGTMLLSYAAGDAVRRGALRSVSDRGASYGARIGFLPHLEVGTSFLTASPFNGMIDDRAVSFKYAVLPPGPGLSLAVGSTDVQGTRRRATDYGIVGKRLGPLNLYAGYGRGKLTGFMAGLSYRVTPDLLVTAEHIGGLAMLGAKGRFAGRFSAALGIDAHRNPVIGLGYVSPLRSPNAKAGEPTDDLTPAGVAVRLSDLCHGEATATLSDGELIVAYDDIEARDPVRTLGLALDLCTQVPAEEAERVRVTVRRFGIDRVTLAGPMPLVRSFLQGLTDPDDFLREMQVTDGGSGTNREETPTTHSGETPALLITLEPELGYRLGVQDSLPNKESLLTKGVAPLPFGLLGAVSTQVNLHNDLDDEPSVRTPDIGVFYPRSWGSGLWTLAGIEAARGRSASAELQASYLPPTSPFWFSGQFRQPTHADEKSSYAAHAQWEMRGGNLGLWGRYEKFAAGDTGFSYGATRRFGQNWITLRVQRTSLDGDSVKQVGFFFQGSLPRYGVDAGRVRLTTAESATFAYQATLHVAKSRGMGVTQRPLLSLDGELSTRNQLNAAFVRRQVTRLRTR